MSKRRNKRRFYPEFYTEEELKRRESKKNSFTENKMNEENEAAGAAEIKEGEKVPESDIYRQPDVIIYNGYQPPEISNIPDIEKTISDEINEINENEIQIEIEKIEEPVEEIEEIVEAAEEKSGEDSAPNIAKTDKGGFIQNIFERTYETEPPIIYEESDAVTEKKEINESINYNGLVYSRKPDTAAVYKQIDYMEKDYLQQKIDILNSNQNINSMMNDMDDKSGAEPENEYPEAFENENNGIEIEIPPHMYIDEIPVKQYADYNYNTNYDDNSYDDDNNEEIYSQFSENPIVHNEYKENTVKIAENEGMKPEQTIPVFSPMPELSPNIEITHEPEPEIETEKPPEIHMDAKITPFDCETAMEYARRWALDRNPQYYNFEELGGDCTNYISQILLAGGCKMDKSSPIYGWYYNHANDKSHSWTGVEQLYDYLVRDKEHGIIAKEITLNEVEAGDIVQLSFNGKTFQHTPFVVSVKRMPSGELSYDCIKICAHSFDSENRAMDTYQWRKIRFIRILGYKEK